jgi:hypothetical protein
MFAWPWIDKWLYKDYGPHNLLDRPRDKPLRTAIGVGALTFFVDLTFASATDLLGNDLHIAFERLIEILQYGAFIGPVVAGLIAYRVCQVLQRMDLHPIQRPVGGIILRDRHGAYHTLGDTHHANGGGGDHAANGDGDHVDDHAGNGHALGNGAEHGADGHDGAEVELQAVEAPASAAGSGGDGSGAADAAPADPSA